MSAAGDQAARSRLFELLYEDLRVRAERVYREKPATTLQPSILVHEAWLKLIGQDRTSASDRGHFLALAASVMRRISVDYWRWKHREIRGGRRLRINLPDELPADEGDGLDLVVLSEALERLRTHSERLATVVEMKFFAQLSNQQTADAMGTSVATVARDWRAAKAWLRAELDP